MKNKDMNEENEGKECPPSTNDEEVDEQGDSGRKNEQVEGIDEAQSFPETDELSTSRLVSTGLRLGVITLFLVSIVFTSAVTGIGNLVWHQEAQGHLVEHNGKVVGSKLIGQSFRSERYFHPRPSSKDYDAMNSGSANLSPQNEKLTRRAKKILRRLEEDGINPERVPVTFITESGSSLDPHIVPASAYLQVPRVSEATGIEPEKLREMIDDQTQGKLLGLYGLKRVNVLTLNLEIEKIRKSE